MPTLSMVTAIGLISSAGYLLISVFKVGWIAQFMSTPVITGFLFGAAIEVTVGELHKLTGTAAHGANTWQKFWSWLEGVGATHPLTLLVGGLGLALIIGLRFLDKRIPGALVLLAAGLAASALFHLGDRGVALVGEVPRGLPVWGLPSWRVVAANATPILTAALGLVLIGFSQTAGSTRALAYKHRTYSDLNQESGPKGWPTSRAQWRRVSRLRRACRPRRSTTRQGPRPRCRR